MPNQFTQQIIGQLGQISHQPTTAVRIPPKPIFVMRFRSSMDDGEFRYTKDQMWKSDIHKEYHLILMKNSIDKDEFEMYNADKIERQDWNELVNKIIK